MNKIVRESIYLNVNNKIDEGLFGDIGRFISNQFKKVGKFFFAIINGNSVTSAIAPINVGIMEVNNLINSSISYIPSIDDLKLEPSLSKLTPERLMNKRGHINNGVMHESVNYNMHLYEANVELTHPNKDVRNVDKKELINKIRIAIKNPESVPVMIWGAPGIGKTTIVGMVLKNRGNARLIDIPTSKMSPDDWSLPSVYKDPTSGKKTAEDIVKNWIPTYIPTGNPEEDAKLDEIANQGEGGILFFDELSRASIPVQNTCLKIIHERVIGDARIGSKWSMIAASNRVGDDDAEIGFGSALGNRFQHINYVPTFKNWKEWAIGKVDQRILDFLEFNGSYFYNKTDDAEEVVFASPRSWAAAGESLANLYKDAQEEGYKVSKRDIINVIQDNVGGKVAVEFGTFLTLLETFTKEDINQVMTNPEKAKKPSKAGSGYNLAEANALIAVICTSTKTNGITPEEFTNYCKYLTILNNTSLASKGIIMMADLNPIIHEQIGDDEGKSDYAEGRDIFIKHYGDIDN